MSILDCCNGNSFEVNYEQPKSSQLGIKIALSRRNNGSKNEKIKLSKNNTNKNLPLKKQKQPIFNNSQLFAPHPTINQAYSLNEPHYQEFQIRKNTTHILLPARQQTYYVNYPKQIVSLKNVPSQKKAFIVEGCKKITEYHPNNEWRGTNQSNYPYSSKTLNPSNNTSFFDEKKIQFSRPKTTFNSRISSMNPSMKKIELFDFRQTESIDDAQSVGQSLVLQGEKKMYISHLISGREKKEEKQILQNQNQRSTNHNYSQIY